MLQVWSSRFAVKVYDGLVHHFGHLVPGISQLSRPHGWEHQGCIGWTIGCFQTLSHKIHQNLLEIQIHQQQFFKLSYLNYSDWRLLMGNLTNQNNINCIGILYQIIHLWSFIHQYYYLLTKNSWRGSFFWPWWVINKIKRHAKAAEVSLNSKLLTEWVLSLKAYQVKLHYNIYDAFCKTKALFILKFIHIKESKSYRYIICLTFFFSLFLIWCYCNK